MNTKPKALRLADALEELDVQFSQTGLCGEAAAELRRLHEWVGLTDEEQTQVAWSFGSMSVDWLEFAQAIEAKLKERNHG